MFVKNPGAYKDNSSVVTNSEIKMGLVVEKEVSTLLGVLAGKEVEIIQEDREYVIETTGLRISMCNTQDLIIETDTWRIIGQDKFCWNKSDIGSNLFTSDSIKTFLSNIKKILERSEKAIFTETGLQAAV
jgi:hypothetical protein